MELPPVAGFRETPPLHTVPVEEMETSEDCLTRLVREVASNSNSGSEQISETELKQVLTAEITYQCNLKVSQEFLNPLFEEQKSLWKQQQQLIKEQENRQEQQPQLINYANHWEITDYRNVIKRKLGNHNIKMYCSGHYESTVCGICELDLANCLSQAKHNKKRCEYFFADCIDEVKKGIDRIHEVYQRCIGDMDIIVCIEDEIRIDDIRLIMPLIFSYEDKVKK